MFQTDKSTYIKTDERAKGGKYATEAWTYPADLFGSPEKYGNSWVMININVQKSGSFAEFSKTYGNWGVVELQPNEIRRNTFFDQRPALTPGEASASLVAGGAVAGALTSFVKDAAAGNLSNLPRVAVDAGKAARTGGVLGALSSIPIVAGGTASRETKRIVVAIQLPMPNSLNTAYRMSYGESDTDLLDLTLRAPGATIDALSNIFKASMVDDGGGAFNAAMGSALGSAGNAAAGLALKAAPGGISAMSGLASNPKKEIIFNGVDFRTFEMSYKLVPRSKEESDAIENIIYLLKFHMHPEYSASGNFTFVYPSEFDITFYTMDGNENQYVNKIATCVLENVAVNYTPDGQWVPHDQGAPNAIELKLQFRELSILTKEMIAKGF